MEANFGEVCLKDSAREYDDVTVFRFDNDVYVIEQHPSCEGLDTQRVLLSRRQLEALARGVGGIA